MTRLLKDLVWSRAISCCEYCLMPQEYTDATHEIDHIIAEKHQGVASESNLGLSCFACNNSKGPNIAGIDPQSQVISRLFHPMNPSLARTLSLRRRHPYWKDSYRASNDFSFEHQRPTPNRSPHCTCGGRCLPSEQ